MPIPQMRSFLNSMPQLPERPMADSLRPTIKENPGESVGTPDLPELPQHMKLSRQSIQDSVMLSQQSDSPDITDNLHELTEQDFTTRYSLMSDETECDQESHYLQDMNGRMDNTPSDLRHSRMDNTSDLRHSEDGSETLEEEAKTLSDGDTETFEEFDLEYHKRLLARGSDSAGYGTHAKSVISDDTFTETSMNSDEEEEVHETDPLDPENTRKLERDIKKLMKDLQKRADDASV
jgi:hypothetical protein